MNAGISSRGGEGWGPFTEKRAQKVDDGKREPPSSFHKLHLGFGEMKLDAPVVVFSGSLKTEFIQGLCFVLFFLCIKSLKCKKAIWCYCQKSTDCSCLSILTKTGFRFSFAVSAVFDYAYRDYILSWYIPLSHDEGQLYSMLSEDWWQMIGQLRSRLAEIDLVNVVCYDSIRILHTHFTDLKAASARCTNTHSLIV